MIKTIQPIGLKLKTAALAIDLLIIISAIPVVWIVGILIAGGILLTMGDNPTIIALLETPWPTLTFIVVVGVALILLCILFCEAIYQATPGKMIIGAKIVIAETGGKPSFIRILSRFIAYLVLTILTLGFSALWIVFDKKRQGLHDKITGTVVIRRPRRSKAKK